MESSVDGTVSRKRCSAHRAASTTDCESASTLDLLCENNINQTVCVRWSAVGRSVMAACTSAGAVPWTARESFGRQPAVLHLKTGRDWTGAVKVPTI